MKMTKPILWLPALFVSAMAFGQPKVGGSTSVSTGIGSDGAEPSIPMLTAQSALVMDAESGKVLYAKEPNAARFPASTTKIMTAMLLLEHTKPDDLIVAPPGIDKVTDASMHLKPGEKITAHDMLYALMLRSANDGCVAVAIHVSGSMEKFIELMNARATELGCTNTHFNNTNGLNDPKHTTTAHDLAIIARAAMLNPDFAAAVRTYRYTIKRDPKISKDFVMVNHDKYLMKDPSADGIKTGWTIPAGRCFVGSATRQGYRLITVVLKSKDWQLDHAALLNWAFAAHQRGVVVAVNQAMGSIAVDGGTLDSVHLRAATPVAHLWARNAASKVETRFDQPQAVRAPIQRGQKLGTATVTDQDGFVQTVDLVAVQNVSLSTTASIIRSASSNSPMFFLVGSCLGMGAFYARKRSRRRVLKPARQRA